jgi:hypothetical protein
MLSCLIVGLLENGRYARHIIARGMAIAVSVIVERNWKNYQIRWSSRSYTLFAPVASEK